MNYLQDRIRGSLIGGAIGDALGYPIEFFSSYAQILDEYGEQGITRLDTHSRWAHDGLAVFSDDTQMTLFTACGLLNAHHLGIDPLQAISHAYLEWLQTQQGTCQGMAECWIRDVPELNHRRAPGNTCITSMESISLGHEPNNYSKGCGGVMRIAPIPLYAAVGGRMTIEEAARLAADAARLTHLHPMGYIPAALESCVIYRLAQDEHPTRDAMEQYICDACNIIAGLYSADPRHLVAMQRLAEQAMALAANDQTDVDNIASLGEGWVGEEAVAIGLYCALRHFSDFEQAMIAAVNHSGDSDSTGAIAGNILGAAVGHASIPDYYKSPLELHDLILHLADDLYGA